MGYVIAHQLGEGNEVLNKLAGEYSPELLKQQLENAKNLKNILDQDGETCG